MEYVNIISQTVFQQDSRHVLPHVLLQRECALHGGVYVHVPHNMSVIHNMSFFAELGTHQFEEFNSSICAIFESQHFVDNIAVNKGPTSPRCSTLMPSFDKMILSKSPTGAVTTAFYHATDRHVVTANKEQYVLTSVTASKDQQFVRLGNKTMNLLNRAYTMPQLQVECGSTVKFTTDEISSTEHGTLMSNNDQAVMAKVATTLSWSNIDAQLRQDDFVEEPNRSCHNSLLSRDRQTRCDCQQGAVRFDLSYGQQGPTLRSAWQQDHESAQQGLHHASTPSGMWINSEIHNR